MNSVIARLRFKLLNKPKHKTKRKAERPAVPYIGPEQWLLLASNQRYRDRATPWRKDQ